jgi:predicted Fe-Mo cluster-binding NifX family protein
MIIAIATNENFLKGFIDQHFGRCNWYCIHDTETGKTKFIENPVRHNQEKAGCDAAEMLAKQHVKMVVAGRFGSKVVELFNNYKIQMIVPELERTNEQIIKQLK